MAEKIRILIVEDEALVAEDLREMLDKMGYEFAGVSDTGAGAIALAYKHRPDLVFMDINLSGRMDGITAASEIRKRWGIPVIYITAFSTQPLIDRAKETTPSGYILKPFNVRQIQTAIEIALYNAKIEQELAAERLALHKTQEALRSVNKLLEDKVRSKTRELEDANLALNVRVKELNCLYGISALLELPKISIDEILNKIVMLLPPAWQFPEITTACISIKGMNFQTTDFYETPWRLAREIIVNGSPIGEVIICYMVERQVSDKGPFLKEEEKLLNTIAKQISRIIESKYAEERLSKSEIHNQWL